MEVSQNSEAEIVAEAIDEPRAFRNLPLKPVAPSKTYVVPQRFGLSAIFGIMTALALLFGVLQRLDAPPLTYLFFGVLGIVICIVQMCFGGVPRKASIVAGITVYAFFVGLALVTARRIFPELVIGLAISVLPVGALIGYLSGTCAAGIFLVMDYLEQALRNRREALARGGHTGLAP